VLWVFDYAYIPHLANILSISTGPYKNGFRIARNTWMNCSATIDTKALQTHLVESAVVWQTTGVVIVHIDSTTAENALSVVMDAYPFIESL
jgi:hypothetical protein